MQNLMLPYRPLVDRAWFHFEKGFRQLRAGLAADDLAVATATLEDPPAPCNIFTRSEGRWRVGFASGEVRMYPDLDGFYYISRLLQQPDGCTPLRLRGEKVEFSKAANLRSVASTESVHGAASEGPNYAVDAGSAADPEALASYKDRLRELIGDLETARKNNDEAELSRLQLESELLQAHIEKTRGLGGRPVQLSKENKKAGDAVRNAINRAIEAIMLSDQALGAHLSRSIEFGGLFRYAPVEAVRWTT